jgi:4'-phosphopantetheinyl transferase
MIEIFASTIPPGAAAADFAGLLPLLAPEKRQRVERMTASAPLLQTLYGELLARLAIARRLCCPLRSIRLDCAANGKPFLAGGGLHFNVAHSRDRVVCAISAKEIGVDIEVIRPIEMEVARRFFSAEEYAALSSLPETERPGKFFQLWTLKESYLKAVGTGLRKPLSSFTLKIRDETIAIHSGDKIARAYGFRSWLWEGVCWIGLCALERPLPAEFRVVPEAALRRALAELASDLI